MTPSLSQRLLVICAGLFGASAVAALAAAAHAGGGNLSTAGAFLLAHAPVLLVAGLAGRGALMMASAWLLAAGTVLFSGDLVLRDLADTRLFPLAAPIGGMTMMAGWLAIAVSGALRR